MFSDGISTVYFLISVTCADVERVNSALKTGETHNVEHQAPVVSMRWCRVHKGNVEHQAPVGLMRRCHVHKVNVEHQAPVGSMRWCHVHKVNVEHQAPGSAQ